MMFLFMPPATPGVMYTSRLPAVTFVMTSYFLFGPALGFPNEVFEQQYQIIEEGDVNIGAIVSMHDPALPDAERGETSDRAVRICSDMINSEQSLADVTAILYAIDEINQNPTILPNITLGKNIQPFIIVTYVKNMVVNILGSNSPD